MTDEREPTLRFLSHGRRTTNVDEPVDLAFRHRVAALTDVGQHREGNQDHFLVARLERRLEVLDSSIRSSKGGERDHPPALLMAVADGMGGMRGGEVASAVAIDALAEHAMSLLPWIGAATSNSPEMLAGLRDTLHQTQARFKAVASRKGLDVRMGTTLTAAYVAWPLLHVLHVGDSRGYLFRDGRLHRLTRDQTLAQAMVEAGQLDAEKARRSPLSHVLTSAIGGGDQSFDLEVGVHVLNEGDVLLLCTDGLYGELSEQTVADRLGAVGRKSDLEGCAASLIASANEAGGHDNITVVVAAFD